MSKRPSAELTGSPAPNASGVGVGNEEEILFREDADKEEGNILMSMKSRTCRKQMTDNQLFLYFDELLEAQANVLCRNINCSCLNILKEDDRVRALVSKYLAGFERKNKHEQDSIILDQYRFAEALRYGRRQVWYCLLYDRTWCEDMEDVLNIAQGHKLCTKGLCSVMGIGHNRFQSIRHASIKGIIPSHKAVGKKSNHAIKTDDPRMIHLKNHFKYLHKLAEDRAVKVMKKWLMERGSTPIAWTPRGTSTSQYTWVIEIAITVTWNCLGIRSQ
jgi:hypothetical protein